MFTGKKRKKVEFLTYVMIVFITLVTLFGCINIYKSCKIIDNQANANFIYLAKSIKESENNYFQASEQEAEHCKKVIELTINKQKLEKISKTAYKYNKYNIPYVENYLQSIVSPQLLFSAHQVDGVISIYFIFNYKFIPHKNVIGLWYTNIHHKKLFNITDNGSVSDMFPIESQDLKWYYSPKKLKKGSWITPPYKDRDIKIDMITYSTPVYVDKTFIGIAGVDISINEIKNYVYKLKIYKTGKAYLIDQNNQIIFAKDYKASTSTSVIDKNLYKFLNNISNKGKDTLKLNDIKLLKSSSSKKLFAITKLYNGFILVLEAPYNELYAETIKLVRLTSLLLGLFIIIILLTTIIANGYIKKIYNYLVQKEKYTRTVLNNIKDGIITINDNFIIEDCNPAIELIFDYSASEIIGQKLDLLMHYECDNKEKKICLSEKENYGMKKNGLEFPIEIDVSETNFENKILTLLVIRDITEQEKIDKMKNEFISTVSHELKTPLTSIKGSMGLLASGVFGKLPGKLEELVNIANNNCTRLINLINDILDVEKIASGKMTFQTDIYNLTSIVQKAIEMSTEFANQHKVKLNYMHPLLDSEFNANVDKYKLIQVLTNLISNAVKFSPSDSSVEIELFHIDRNIRISVMDHGPGIEEKYINQIFEKFTQADSSDSRKNSGTGLGLYISKYIIEQMNGKLEFNTELGVGSIFYIDLIDNDFNC